MSIVQKLNYLIGTKNAIKQAIIDKGVDVQESDTFRSYSEKIGEIKNGGIETQTIKGDVYYSTVLCKTTSEVI